MDATAQDSPNKIERVSMLRPVHIFAEQKNLEAAMDKYGGSHSKEKRLEMVGKCGVLGFPPVPRLTVPHLLTTNAALRMCPLQSLSVSASLLLSRDSRGPTTLQLIERVA